MCRLFNFHYCFSNVRGGLVGWIYISPFMWLFFKTIKWVVIKCDNQSKKNWIGLYILIYKNIIYIEISYWYSSYWYSFVMYVYFRYWDYRLCLCVSVHEDYDPHWPSGMFTIITNYQTCLLTTNPFIFEFYKRTKNLFSVCSVGMFCVISFNLKQLIYLLHCYKHGLK